MGRCGRGADCLRRRIRVPGDIESFRNALKDWMARCVASRSRGRSGEPVRREEILVSRENLSVIAIWGEVLQRGLVGSEVEILADYACSPPDTYVTQITFSLPAAPPPSRVETPVQPADRGTQNRGVTDQTRSTPPQGDAPHGIRLTYRDPAEIPGVLPRQVLNGEVGPISAFLFKVKVRWNAQWEARVGSEDSRIEVIRTEGESLDAQINFRLQQDVTLRFSAEWQEDALTALANMFAGRQPITVEGLIRLLRPKFAASLVTQDDAARVGRQEVRVGIETSSETPIFAEYVRRFRIVGTAGQQGNLRCRVKFSLGLNPDGWVRLLELVRERVRDAATIGRLLRPLARYLGSAAFAKIAPRLGIAGFVIAGAIGFTYLVTWMHRRQITRGQIEGLWSQYAGGYVLRICLTGRHPDDEHRWWGDNFSERGSQEIRVAARRQGIEDAQRAISSQGQQQALRALQENFGVNCADPSPGIFRFTAYLVAHSSSDPTGRIEQP